MDTSHEKKELRSYIRSLLMQITESERKEASGRIIESIQAQPIWQAAAVVLAYIPLATEVDILELLTRALELGKTVGIPRCLANGSLVFHRIPPEFQQELISGPYSLQEPPEHWSQIVTEKLHETTLILVPAYAYTPCGARLGKGKGYYDRTLGQAAKTCTTMGVCFEKQIMQRIPTAGHDRSVDIVITENHVYDSIKTRCSDEKC